VQPKQHKCCAVCCQVRVYTTPACNCGYTQVAEKTDRRKRMSTERAKASATLETAHTLPIPAEHLDNHIGQPKAASDPPQHSTANDCPGACLSQTTLGQPGYATGCARAKQRSDSQATQQGVLEPNNIRTARLRNKHPSLCTHHSPTRPSRQMSAQ
jgi:hypothetical protein